ncbi:hypothetical protein CEXT_653891 [Caerostris extrusa]|uniref:Uncharacterized protein n=1 Tax=Caerostris extrusa TaxID=172846 RepID=A0AAV4YE98_CAEEX|nr:hypothetical protein CEXT_653891 [Caerostris extrusa]
MKHRDPSKLQGSVTPEGNRNGTKIYRFWRRRPSEKEEDCQFGAPKLKKSSITFWVSCWASELKVNAKSVKRVQIGPPCFPKDWNDKSLSQKVHLPS